MSPKKTILKTLSDRQKEHGSSTPIRPLAIPGFQEAPEKYQHTINNLLKERMIEGVKDADGHLAISLNSHRAGEVRKALRPLWAHPATLTLLGLLAVVAGVTLLG